MDTEHFDAIVAKSREGVEAWMRGLKGTEVIVGDACFVGPGTLAVGGRRLSGRLGLLRHRERA